MINNNKLYESIIKDVAKIIKLNLLNEGKYDNVDHSHNNKFNFTTNRVMMHYNGLGIYATHLSLNKQELDHTAADILMKNIYNSTNVGLKLVYRKSSSKHNYCLQIIDNDINIFDDDKITHIAFMNELEKPNKFKVYILEKTLIKTVYDNLKNKIDVIKSSINKRLIDKNSNFLNNTKGKEGICLSNDFVKNNKIDSFLLNEI